jgi:hypothetical protein
VYLGKIEDVTSFMKVIGRNCEEVAGKFEVKSTNYTECYLFVYICVY